MPPSPSGGWGAEGCAQPWPAAEPPWPQSGSAGISQMAINGMTGRANAQGHLAIGSTGTGLLSWEEDVGKENSTPLRPQAHVGATGMETVCCSPHTHPAARTPHCDGDTTGSPAFAPHGQCSAPPHPLPAGLHQCNYCSVHPDSGGCWGGAGALPEELLPCCQAHSILPSTVSFPAKGPPPWASMLPSVPKPHPGSGGPGEGSGGRCMREGA